MQRIKPIKKGGPSSVEGKDLHLVILLHFTHKGTECSNSSEDNKPAAVLDEFRLSLAGVDYEKVNVNGVDIELRALVLVPRL